MCDCVSSCLLVFECVRLVFVCDDVCLLVFVFVVACVHVVFVFVCSVYVRL